MRLRAICLSLLVAGTARAGAFHDDRGFDLDPPATVDQHLCVVLPRPARADSLCADLADAAAEVEKIARSGGPTLVGFAFARSPEAVQPVSVMREEPKAAELTDARIDAHIAGFASGLQKQVGPVRVREREGRRWDRASYAGVAAVRFAIDSDAGPISLCWMVYGKRGTYTLAVLTDAKHEAAVRARTEQSLRGLKLP